MLKKNKAGRGYRPGSRLLPSWPGSCPLIVLCFNFFAVEVSFFRRHPIGLGHESAEKWVLCCHLQPVSGFLWIPQLGILAPWGEFTLRLPSVGTSVVRFQFHLGELFLSLWCSRQMMPLCHCLSHWERFFSASKSSLRGRGSSSTGLLRVRVPGLLRVMKAGSHFVCAVGTSICLALQPQSVPFYSFFLPPVFFLSFQSGSKFKTYLGYILYRTSVCLEQEGIDSNSDCCATRILEHLFIGLSQPLKCSLWPPALWFKSTILESGSLDSDSGSTTYKMCT